MRCNKLYGPEAERPLSLVRTTIRQNHSRAVNITGILSKRGATASSTAKSLAP